MSGNPESLIRKLQETRSLEEAEYAELIRQRTPESARLLADLAVAERKRLYGNDVFIRGLIEFTNICRNDCLYCGLRRSNTALVRYRLTPEEILSCAEDGYTLGFREPAICTFRTTPPRLSRPTSGSAAAMTGPLMPQ